MLRQLFVLVILACLTIGSNSYYTIVGPSYIQSDSTYKVALFSDATFPTTISLTIKNDKKFSTTQSVRLNARSNKVVDFSLGSLEAGEYKFIATGQKQLTFVNETTLTLQAKTKSVFIQTDKAMYKPGNKVQFRVIVVDKNLNPAKIKKLDIFITDASQNRIEQWLGASISKGIHIGSLQLADTPCLGNWKINVNVDDESSEKIFEVAEYVLPKFEVTVTAPKDSTYSDGALMISIKALYTYGENVKGAATVTITRNYPWDPSPQPTIAQKTVNIDGNAVAQFNIASELKVNENNWQDDFKVTVAVTEALTGVVLEGSTVATIRRQKFTVTNLDNTGNYNPGPYTLSLQFSYFDGSPYLDSVNTITVSYGTNYDKTNTTTLGTGKIGANGVADIEINLPSMDQGFYIFAKFLNFYDNVGWYQKSQPSVHSDENSLSVRLLTKDPNIKDVISVEVSSSNDLCAVNYLLTARGNLILSKTEYVAHTKSVVIDFRATFDMVPSARFVAYYITPKGNIVAGNVQISVKGLNNHVKIKTSPKERQPGESVTISIKTRPSSQVCVLGIDQSVALLKTGNDIVLPDVYNELGKYETYGGGGYPIIDPIPIGPMPMPGPIFLQPAVDVAVAPQPELAVAPERVASRKKRSIWWPGGGGSRHNFDNAGLFLLTNCNESPIIYFDDMLLPMAPAAPLPMAPMDPAVEDSPTSQPTAQEVRKYFPETWIWSCTDSGNIMFANAAMGGGPVLEKAVSAPSTSSPEVRKFFPETWIWNCSFSCSQNIDLFEKAPDTITSWYITGFATNEKFGLGVTEDKTVFKVFKKFFVSLNLPYSAKRDEGVLIQIVVFNYLARKVSTKVTLDNSLKQFEFVDPLTQVYKDKGCPLPIETSRSKTVTVNANDGVSLSFVVRPLIVGPMLIKVSATSASAGDAIEMPLLVVAEGVTQYKNKAVFVDLRETNTFTTNLTVDIPEKVVPDSTKVQVSAIGDVMGVALQNLDNLITMPCGCGEQTMLGLAPDVVIYDYLTKVGLLTPALKTKLLDYMKKGYQGQLSYKHDDHSFSAFGNSDRSGSSWLTAFVLKIFIQASPYITIDENIIAKGLIWLVGRQQKDGHFDEPGNVCHTDMQGEASKGVALTAYIVVTFLADPAKAQLYAGVINKALDYIYQTLLTLDDIYSLAIATYAAQLANYEHKDTLLQKIESLAQVRGNQKWWEKVRLVTPTDPWSRPPSVNVEITGYVLLAYIKAGKALDCLPIVNWLLAQQSNSGGFGSTQDTVVGITALATFAAIISGSNVMSCTFNYAASSSTINIDQTNSLVLQSVELPSTTKSVAVTCTGSGFSLVQVSYQFNLNNVEVSPRFVLDVEVDKKSNDYSLVLNICTSFIAGNDGNTTNMAIVEAELPTGFTADLQTTKSALASVKGFKKVETKNGNTVIVIYLDNLSTVQVCLQVFAYRLCQIADEKPVAVIVQDYYSNDRRKTTFYSRTPKDVCSICDNDECKAACGKSTKDIQCPKATGR
ncbi:CD109 antigen [Pseudolycoriella hygida]|uniref:TEP1-F n=1 Tax=Pseudolycoriella hygida TaxID=35572 RepID=A0A9Q0MKY8_9DIPT|nr:CD109 antigen [Pseudolycoriella hygida]